LTAICDPPFCPPAPPLARDVLLHMLAAWPVKLTAAEIAVALNAPVDVVQTALDHLSQFRQRVVPVVHCDPLRWEVSP
jgi:hypothetical protein